MTVSRRTLKQRKGKREKRKFFLTSYFLLLTSFALATTYPYTVTDDLGREVTLQAEPTRIVAMIPSHTETVCALGALVTGLSAWTSTATFLLK